MEKDTKELLYYYILEHPVLFNNNVEIDAKQLKLIIEQMQKFFYEIDIEENDPIYKKTVELISDYNIENINPIGSEYNYIGNEIMKMVSPTEEEIILKKDYKNR